MKNKVSTGGVGAFDIDEELIPPCDSDDTEMTPGECAALPTDPMKYYKVREIARIFFMKTLFFKGRVLIFCSVRTLWPHTSTPW